MLRSAAVLVLLAALTATAEDAPQSAGAKKAKAEFDAGIKKLDEEYQKKTNEHREAYLKELETARAAALARKDLNEAMRILAEQKEWGNESGATASLQIIAASFGYHDKWLNVTPTVRQLVKNGELQLASAYEANKGPDPAAGQHKTLVIVYRLKGVLRVTVAGDDKPVAIPAKR